MKKIYIFAVFMGIVFTSGCMGRSQYEVENMYGLSPHCRKETTVAIYDKDGMHTFPGCADYEYEDSSADVTVEREFPLVPDNKHYQPQVIMENLNTRVLAYCRGSEEEIEECVSMLENSCYTRISEVPYMAAKYDMLKIGTYPTRRWREGETVPRW